MGLFGKMIKTGLDVAFTPVEIAKDVVTLGGLVTGEDEPYTLKHCKEIVDDADEMIDDVFRIDS